MSGKRGSKWHMEDLSGEEVYSAIRYLEAVPKTRDRNHDAFVICFWVVSLVLGFLGIMCLCYPQR